MSGGPRNIDIVPIGPAEAAAMAPVHAAAFGAEAWSEVALGRLLRADAARAFGAFAGYERTPLGLVLAFVAADEAEVLTIGVDPAHQRVGLGARLIRALIVQLREEGMVKLVLEVAADSPAVQGFYRRLGFAEIGRRRGYYARAHGPAVDALMLGLSLEAGQGPEQQGPATGSRRQHLR